MTDTDSTPTAQSDDRRWRRRVQARMERRRRFRKSALPSRREQGLVIVHTGRRKGKTTAALDGPSEPRSRPPCRHRAVHQGAWSCGELALSVGDQIVFHATGGGFHVGDAGPCRDKEMAQAGWVVALGYLADPAFKRCSSTR